MMSSNIFAGIYFDFTITHLILKFGVVIKVASTKIPNNPYPPII